LYLYNKNEIGGGPAEVSETSEIKTIVSGARRVLQSLTLWFADEIHARRVPFLGAWLGALVHNSVRY